MSSAWSLVPLHPIAGRKTLVFEAGARAVLGRLSGVPDGERFKGVSRKAAQILVDEDGGQLKIVQTAKVALTRRGRDDAFGGQVSSPAARGPKGTRAPSQSVSTRLALRRTRTS